MSHLDILDITVKLIRRGIKSDSSGSGGNGGSEQPTVSTTAVLGAAKLGTMKLGET